MGFIMLSKISQIQKDKYHIFFYEQMCVCLHKGLCEARKGGKRVDGCLNREKETRVESMCKENKSRNCLGRRERMR